MKYTFLCRVDISMLRESIDTSVLSKDDPIYLRECGGFIHYYKATLMSVTQEGQYDLTINSTIAIYTRVHKNHFDPTEPERNLLQQFYGNCFVNQLKFSINLWPGEIYYLIVATIFSSAMAPYSVASTGSSYVNFYQTSKYYVFFGETTLEDSKKKYKLRKRTIYFNFSVANNADMTNMSIRPFD